MPDHNRPSWRPQDEGARSRRHVPSRELEYGDEERFSVRERERMGSQWDDRSTRWDDREERHPGSGYLGQAGQEMGYGWPSPRERPRVEHAVPGGHRGKGPLGYTRSDERIRELVCEALIDNDYVDATNIDVRVADGEVTLNGTVEDRRQKRIAEDCIEHVSGVNDVVNQLRIAPKP